jgi:hypothetical protein
MVVETIFVVTARNTGTAGKLIIMDGLSVQTIARDGNCLSWSLVILQVGRGQYSRHG